MDEIVGVQLGIRDVKKDAIDIQRRYCICVRMWRIL